MPNLNYPPELPISGRREEIVAALSAHQVLIVAGDTGSGKTTQLPKMCLEAGLGRERMIACTQPRRIAATSVAARVAAELGAEGPALVGYRIRFADRTRATTRVKFLTDGMLLAEAAGDHRLSAYDAVIIDEAHERSVNIDFLLGILKRLCPRRPELKVIISSATLDTGKFSRHFDQAPVITIPGQTFPVELHYLPAPETEEEDPSPVEQAVAATRLLARQHPPGDILVFMATERDILETAELLRAGPDEIEVLPLFGRLSSREQARIFAPCPRRKVVVATNVAETSLTVPGIRYVVDSGQARIASYSPRARTTKLPVRPISKASADQRRGRCGRLGPGLCLRLYSEEDYQRREDFTPPEIVRTNLAEVILRMLDLQLGLPGEFPFLDPPNPRSIKDGLALLKELAAVEFKEGEDGPRLTKLGRAMARLPLDPCLSRMILEARERGVAGPVTVIAAALSIQNPRLRPPGQEQEADQAHRRFLAPASDFITLLNLWRQYHQVAGQVSRNRLTRFCRQNFLSPQRMREWCDIHQQIGAALGTKGAEQAGGEELPAGESDAIHQSILGGLLRNIAVKKEKNLYTAALGREVMVFPGSGQFNRGGQWLVAAEMVETTRLYARTVATINPDWLKAIAGPLCRYSYRDPHWEKRRGQVVAFQKITLFGLTIVNGLRVNYGPINPAESREIFIQTALVEGEIGRDLDFLNRNRRLIERARELEERLRRPVVDDYALADFYQRRLPEEVRDLASLSRALPRLKASLLMSEDDLLGPDGQAGRDFPAELAAGPFRLTLSYRFSPGGQEDGVSVLIPQAAKAHLDPAVFDWLVPGLREEKVILLLRALPKATRKRLLPVAETAARLLDGLAPRAGESLTLALSRRVKELMGFDIAPGEWREEELPDHLRMRLCLVDEEGRTLIASRNFAELFASRAPQANGEGLPLALRRRWERKGVTGLNNGPPRRLPILGPDGTLSGYAFPALGETGERGLGIRLFASEAEAKGRGREGLRSLYGLHLEAQMRRLAKDYALAPSEWPLCQWLGGLKEVNAALHGFLLDQLLLLRQGLPSGEEFERRLAELAEGGLYQRAGEIFRELRLLLRERNDTVQELKKFHALAPGSPFTEQRFSDYAGALARLLPPDFLVSCDLEAIRLAPRYLKALRLRVERAHADPGRDQDKGRLLAGYLRQAEELKQQWVQLAIPARREAAWPQVRQFCRLVDEFWVSVFAPELKTLLPVSVKRLEQAYREAKEALG